MCGVKSVRLDLTERERKDLKLIMEEEGITTASQVVRYLIRKYARDLRERRRQTNRRKAGVGG